MSGIINQVTAIKISFIDVSGSSLLSTKRFMPAGGDISAIIAFCTIKTPNHRGLKPKFITIGNMMGIVIIIEDMESNAVPNTKYISIMQIIMVIGHPFA